MNHIENLGSKCCGCEACLAVCPKNCIDMIEDKEGFLYPKTKEELCIHCKLCDKVCPILNKVDYLGKTERPDVYAAWIMDENIRMKSSSGGVFTSLARKILSKNGAVAGAAFDNNLELYHILVDHESRLETLRGSKYIQSKMRNVYADIQKYLKEGKNVLFTGTPCQVAALYSFLGKDNERLMTCDLICHGVPSSKVFRKIIEYNENDHKSKVRNVNFRDKRVGWKRYNVTLYLYNGREVSKCFFNEPFMTGFIKNIYLRPSCHECNYVGIPRIGDLTLGDFWGIEEANPKLNDDKGVSVVLVNSSRGKRFLEECSGSLVLEKSDLEDAIKGNPCLIRSVQPSSKRDEFFKDLQVGFNDTIIKKYLTSRNLNDNLFKKLKRVAKRIAKQLFT